MYTLAELSFIKHVPLCISKMDHTDDTIKIVFDMPFVLNQTDFDMVHELRKRMKSQELFHINFFNYINDCTCKRFDDVVIESIRFSAKVEDSVEIEIFCSGWWQEDEVQTAPINLGQMLSMRDRDIHISIKNKETELPQYVTAVEFTESRHSDSVQGRVEFFNGFMGSTKQVQDYFDFTKVINHFDLEIFCEPITRNIDHHKFDLLNIKDCKFRFYSKTVEKSLDKITFDFSR